MISSAQQSAAQTVRTRTVHRLTIYRQFSAPCRFCFDYKISIVERKAQTKAFLSYLQICHAPDIGVFVVGCAGCPGCAGFLFCEFVQQGAGVFSRMPLSFDRSAAKRKKQRLRTFRRPPPMRFNRRALFLSYFVLVNRTAVKLMGVKSISCPTSFLI